MSQTVINFVTYESKLKEMAYGDAIYAWLLLHSHYNPEEHHNYIYKNEFTYVDIAKDIGRSRQTVSKRFNELLEKGKEKYTTRPLIMYDPILKCYFLPNFSDFQKLHAETVMNLFRLSS